MALIKGIEFYLSALVGIVLLSSAVASEDESLLVELRGSLEKVVSSEMADLFRTDLKDTGLSSLDIERIVAELEVKVVACFLESVVEHSQNHETRLVDLIHEFEGEMGISPVGSDFALLLNSCLNAARLEAGIAGLEMD